MICVYMYYRNLLKFNVHYYKCNQDQHQIKPGQQLKWAGQRGCDPLLTVISLHIDAIPILRLKHNRLNRD